MSFAFSSGEAIKVILAVTVSSVTTININTVSFYSIVAYSMHCCSAININTTFSASDSVQRIQQMIYHLFIIKVEDTISGKTMTSSHIKCYHDNNLQIHMMIKAWVKLSIGTTSRHVHPQQWHSCAHHWESFLAWTGLGWSKFSFAGNVRKLYVGAWN